jgi:hypothetical protein
MLPKQLKRIFIPKNLFFTLARTLLLHCPVCLDDFEIGAEARRCYVSINFILGVLCHGWSFIVLVQFAGFSCLLKRPSVIQMLIGTAVIRGRGRVIRVKLVMVVVVIKREVGG